MQSLNTFTLRMHTRVAKMRMTEYECSFIYDVLEDIESKPKGTVRQAYYEKVVTFSAQHMTLNVKDAMASTFQNHVDGWLETAAWDMRLLEDACMDEHRYTLTHPYLKS